MASAGGDRCCFAVPSNTSRRTAARLIGFCRRSGFRSGRFIRRAGSDGARDMAETRSGWTADPPDRGAGDGRWASRMLGIRVTGLIIEGCRGRVAGDRGPAYRPPGCYCVPVIYVPSPRVLKIRVLPFAHRIPSDARRPRLAGGGGERGGRPCFSAEADRRSCCHRAVRCRDGLYGINLGARPLFGPRRIRVQGINRRDPVDGLSEYLAFNATIADDDRRDGQALAQSPRRIMVLCSLRTGITWASFRGAFRGNPGFWSRGGPFPYRRRRPPEKAVQVTHLRDFFKMPAEFVTQFNELILAVDPKHSHVSPR